VDAVGLSPVIAAPSDRRSGSPIQDSRQSRDLYEPPILIRVKAATTRRMECLALLNLQFHSRQAIIRTEITVDLTSVASAHTFFSGNGVFSLAILSQSRDDTRLQYGNIQMIIPNKIMPSNHLEELCWASECPCWPYCALHNGQDTLPSNQHNLTSSLSRTTRTWHRWLDLTVM
jgi:hypothetical protein